MKRLKQQADESPKNKYIKFAKFGVIIFLAVIFLEIWMVNRLSTYGANIQQLKAAQANLQMENQIFKNKLSENSALVNVESKASSLGFVSTKNYDYFKVSMIASAN